jgi:hypothetical protein
MRINVERVRQIVREEIERMMNRSAGMFGGGGISRSDNGVVPPPPGLGSPSEEIENEKQEQDEPSQSVVRANNRAGRRD